MTQLRELGWEGLPPPGPQTRRPNPTTKDQQDPSATPIAISLGLTKGDPQLNVLHPSPLESTTTSETGTIPASPTTQSPSSVSSVSDFTVTGTSDDEHPIDPKAITPHDTFYFEDGNVEVLCGSTLLRIYTSILSFHYPALRWMFARTSLASAESPNGCPRIMSSDSPRDFTTLLKAISLPGYVTLLLHRRMTPLTVRLQIPRTEQSPGFRHIFIPPANHTQVRTTQPPIRATRARSWRIPRDFRVAFFFRSAWGEWL